jgi:hypothetical protein
MLPGTIAQDAITILASLVLVFLSLTIADKKIKQQIVALSLLAYLFYGYGIYVIEQLYNSLYLLYMAICALAFWSIVYGVVYINKNAVQQMNMPKPVRFLSIGCLFGIPVLFYVLWIGQLLPLMRTGDKIEFTYSIFILDMVFVLPAFMVTAVLLIKKNAFGLLFAPILFIKAFTLLFSVGVGGLFQLFYLQAVAVGEIVFYMLLSIIFLALAVLNLWKLRFQEQNTS